MTFEDLIRAYPDVEPIIRNMPEKLKNHLVLNYIPAGTLVHQKGDELTHFGIVCSGEHRVINELENGNIFMIEKNRAVSFLCEVTLLAGKTKSSVTIETLTDCAVLFITLDQFEDWIRQDNNFLLCLSRSISEKLYSSSSRSGERQYHSARYLVLRYFLDKWEQQAPSREGQLIIPLTREEMGQELGITVKTLDRTIAELKCQGLIGKFKGKVTVTKKQHEESRETIRQYITESRRHGDEITGSDGF